MSKKSDRKETKLKLEAAEEFYQGAKIFADLMTTYKEVFKLQAGNQGVAEMAHTMFTRFKVGIAKFERK